MSQLTFATDTGTHWRTSEVYPTLLGRSRQWVIIVMGMDDQLMSYGQRQKPGTFAGRQEQGS